MLGASRRHVKSWWGSACAAAIHGYRVGSLPVPHAVCPFMMRTVSSEDAPIQQADRAANGVQSVDRALRLLKAVAASAEPASAQELASRCAVNRSTAWRLLTTLER